jgi:RimJ/RimL family protein N-acetyltransferase
VIATPAVLETMRLRIRPLTYLDAPFILELLNDDAFLRYIGDKKVRTLDDARSYIGQGPMASYAQHGYGLNLVELRETGAPAGICGILKREALDAPDLGFAFLPAYRRLGFAHEASAAVLDDAAKRLGLSRVLAFTNPDNTASIGLLERLGFSFDRLWSADHREHPVRLYVRVVPTTDHREQ